MNPLASATIPTVTLADLSPRCIAIMRCMRADSRATAHSIAQQVGACRETVIHDRRFLRDLGLVTGPKDHPMLSILGHLLLLLA